MPGTDRVRDASDSAPVVWRERVDEGPCDRGESETRLREPDSDKFGSVSATFLNFAYGSNMATARLRARTPSARPLGVAKLEGHLLRWHKRGMDGSGKCDVVAADSIVWGVLYEIFAAEKPLLDAAEGLHRGYAERETVVLAGGREARRVHLYHATDVDASLQPYHWYKRLVLAGAREHGLPERYVRTLDAVESQPDPDVRRATLHRALLEDPPA
jgi:hypothetical protein